MSSPFSLLSGSSIFASIVCFNEVGDSQISNVGNGAIALLSTVPDPPINLVRNTEISFDQTIIAFKWDNGVSNGN